MNRALVTYIESIFVFVNWKKKLLYSNLCFIFQAKCKIRICLIFKGITFSMLRFDVVYKFLCGGCNATKYDKTKYQFKVRMCQYLELSVLIGRELKLITILP